MSTTVPFITLISYICKADHIYYIADGHGAIVRVDPYTWSSHSSLMLFNDYDDVMCGVEGATYHYELQYGNYEDIRDIKRVEKSGSQMQYHFYFWFYEEYAYKSGLYKVHVKNEKDVKYTQILDISGATENRPVALSDVLGMISLEPGPIYWLCCTKEVTTLRWPKKKHGISWIQLIKNMEPLVVQFHKN
eukprot:407647_1